MYPRLLKPFPHQVSIKSTISTYFKVNSEIQTQNIKSICWRLHTIKTWLLDFFFWWKVNIKNYQNVYRETLEHENWTCTGIIERIFDKKYKTHSRVHLKKCLNITFRCYSMRFFYLPLCSCAVTKFFILIPPITSWFLSYL